jgi:hypothetical protein
MYPAPETDPLLPVSEVRHDAVISTSNCLRLGEPGQITAMLWLNSEAIPAKFKEPAPDATEEEIAATLAENMDGIKIFDRSAIDVLKSQGADKYKQVHDHFYSATGSLSFDMRSQCRFCQSELIPRLSNRMVIVANDMPYTFQTDAASVQEFAKTNASPLGFYQSTALALVITFSNT